MGDKHLNSIKFIFVSLIVYGHVGQYYMLTSKAVFYQFCYLSTFAMPLFIMISGFLSKKINLKKLKSSTSSLLATYFVFQTIFFLPAIIALIFNLNLDLRMVGGEFSLKNYLLMPMGPLWFLPALIFWRFVLFFISKYKIGFKVTMPISILIAVACGFIDVLIPHTKALVFLPFFLLGYYCPKEWLDKIRSYNKIYAIILLVLLFVVVYLSEGNNYLFATYGDPPYSMYTSIADGIIYRLFFYVVAVICSAAVFAISPDIFHKWGTKSMNIYLLHPLFVYPIYYSIIYAFQLNYNVFREVLVAILIIALCLFISRFKVIRYLIYPITILKR